MSTDVVQPGELFLKRKFSPRCMMVALIFGQYAPTRERLLSGACTMLLLDWMSRKGKGQFGSLGTRLGQEGTWEERGFARRRKRGEEERL